LKPMTATAMVNTHMHIQPPMFTTSAMTHIVQKGAHCAKALNEADRPKEAHNSVVVIEGNRYLACLNCRVALHGDCRWCNGSTEGFPRFRSVAP
jgi:hypothetical protein